jgi:hypothetical protein
MSYFFALSLFFTLFRFLFLLPLALNLSPSPLPKAHEGHEGPAPKRQAFDDRLSDDPQSFYGINKEDTGLVPRHPVICKIFDDLTPGKVMVIRGPPGCGKTSLAQLALWEAEARGWGIYPVLAKSIQSFDSKTMATTFFSLDVDELARSVRDVLIVIDDIQRLYSPCPDRVGTAACMCDKCHLINDLLEWLSRGKRGKIRVLLTAVYYHMGFSSSPSDMRALPRVPMTTVMWAREDAIALIEKLIRESKEERQDAVRACREKILSLCETPFGFHIGLVRKMTSIALAAVDSSNMEGSVLRALAYRHNMTRFFPLASESESKAWAISKEEERGLALLLRSPVPISSKLLGSRLEREFLRLCVVYDASALDGSQASCGGASDGTMVALLCPLARRSISFIFFQTESTKMLGAVKDLVMATVVKFSPARLQEMIKASPASQRLRLGKEIGIQHEFYRSLMQVIPVGCECVPEITDPGKKEYLQG